MKERQMNDGKQVKRQSDFYEFDPERHVIFPRLGQYGRFGNQLFQIAATLSHARRLGLEARFPLGSWRREFSWFGLSSRQFMLTGIEVGAVWASEWNYEPIPDSARVLHGYFQSPRFWLFGGCVECPLKSMDVDGCVPLVAHIRRGDYLQVPDHHPPLPAEYYIRAANITSSYDLLGPHSLLQVGTEPHPDVNGDWSPAGPLVDFLTLCSAQELILSNSSFALWAGYLGKARRVYYPRPWFGPALAHLQAEQLIPPSTPEKEWVGVDW